jgi:F-type H+-transporting ATPase subunit epsilon
MAEYLLEVITPEKSFFCEMVESVVLPTTDGQMAIMRGHEKMVIAIMPGELKIDKGGKWLYCSVAPGFVEIRPDETLIFTQSAEWPEEIDIRRAEEAKIRAEERMRQKLSTREYKMNKLAMARAMARLQLSKKNIKL